MSFFFVLALGLRALLDGMFALSSFLGNGKLVASVRVHLNESPLYWDRK